MSFKCEKCGNAKFKEIEDRGEYSNTIYKIRTCLVKCKACKHQFHSYYYPLWFDRRWRVKTNDCSHNPCYIFHTSGNTVVKKNIDFSCGFIPPIRMGTQYYIHRDAKCSKCWINIKQEALTTKVGKNYNQTGDWKIV